MIRGLAALAAATMALAATLGTPAAAQGNPFAPVATANGLAVTAYQVEQRARFLALLRAPNADVESVTGTLLDETLQVQAARAAGIELTPDDLDAGLVEFAARADLTPDAFIAELSRAGVAPETFRDFVRNGLYWRALIQQRFGPIARPSDAQVRAAAARDGGGAAAIRVLLSEIVLPLTPETETAQRALAQRLSDTVGGAAGFEAAAREFSRSGSAPAGGRIDWLPLGQLPPPIASQLLTLSPGEVSEPVALGSVVALFLLRGLDDSGAAPTDPVTVDYAEYLIPGGRSPEALAAAARIRARVDVCDDLYGVARGQPAARLTRADVAIADLPGDLRQVLATLDPGEAATLLLDGAGNLRFTMLCGRGEAPVDERLQAVGQSLVNERLVGFAQGYLDELRADAVIVR